MKEIKDIANNLNIKYSKKTKKQLVNEIWNIINKR